MIAAKNIATPDPEQWRMVDAPPVAPWIPSGFPSAVHAFIHEEPILSAVAAGESRSASADMSRPLRARRQPKSKLFAERRSPVR